uniref:S-layer homology domain-containing protein n=1 Tax=Agathobaculum sp. Marseille-P7918 TaxID=2479843 RepID=UPI0013DD99B1
DGKSVGAVSTYTFEKVSANHTISASFEKGLVVADPDDTGVSSWLNTKDHAQYLNGYPEGTFEPDNNMTRAEAAQMFYNLLLNQDVESTVAFSDVPSDAWYAKAVNTLASLGMINGVGDNKYEPDRSITRAEFTAIAMRFAELPTGGENSFSDVTQNDWFYDVVVGSIQYGWITGYPDGTFRPNATITRAEVTTITNRMLGRSADEAYVDGHAADLRQFSDLSKTHWAYYDIMEATNAHDYTKADGAETWTALHQ